MFKLFTALFALMFCQTLAAEPGGYVYMLRSVEGSQSDATDLYRVNLQDGSEEIVINHKTLPKEFETKMAEPSVSPTGRFVVFVSTPMAVITDENGQVDKQMGWAWGWMGNPDVQFVSQKWWLLDNQDGRIWLLGDDAIDSAVWSPVQDILLINSTTSIDDNYTYTTRIYNPSNNKWRQYRKSANEAIAQWSGNGLGLLLVEPVKKRQSVNVVSLQGKKRHLYTIDAARTIAQSPDHKRFAIFDGKTHGLYSAFGKRLRKLPIKVEEGVYWAEYQFSPDSGHLAVSTWYNYGEPHVFTDGCIWLVDIKLSETRMLFSWNEMVMGSEDQESFSVIGWSPDSKHLLLEGNTTYGEEMPSDAKNDSFSFGYLDVDSKQQEMQVVYRSGKGCWGVDWHDSGRGE